MNTVADFVNFLQEKNVRLIRSEYSSNITRIRSITIIDGVERFQCPICKAAWLEIGQYFRNADYMEAARAIGMPDVVALEVAKWADGEKVDDLMLLNIFNINKEQP